MTKLSLKSSINNSEVRKNNFFCGKDFSESKTSFSVPDKTFSEPHIAVADQGNNVKKTSDKHCISIGHQTYCHLADMLCDAIGDSSYFNGSVDVSGEGFEAVLTLSAVVYRTENESVDGHISSDIADIVPVWWEFSTFAEPFGQVINDFSFSALKPLLLNRS